MNPCLSFQVVDLDFPNTMDSYRLYCMVCSLPNLYFLFCFLDFCLDAFNGDAYCISQRAIASDIKESVCRVPDTPFDGITLENILFL